jgi:glycosyltransferase involved in cell wall biosynthesis
VRTEGLDAIVFDAAEPWLAARTLRSLARRGVRGTIASEDDLVDRVAEARRPVWLVRAGAWTLEAPSRVLHEGAGRSVVALGATAECDAWRRALVDTGGDFARARSWPRLDSAVALDPRSFASLVAEAGTVDRAAALAVSVRSRVVRVPSIDVGFQRALRVVLALTTLHRGGAERIVLDLADDLRALGHDVLVAVMDRAARSTFDEPPGTIHIHEEARSRVERIDRLTALAAERGADVVHAHLLDGDEVVRLARGDVPVVVTVHNSRAGWPARLETALLERSHVDDGPLLLGCSRDVTRELERVGLGGRARTIWNGIQTRATIRRSATDCAAARSALGVSGDGPVLLAVANHRPQKRLERLPSVVAALHARGVAATLILVGEPVRADPESLRIADDVRREADRLGVGAHVVLAGSRADVAPIYAAADVVVSVSAFEGLSLVHLEGLAAGLPLVTTAVSGAEELAAKHAGVHVVPLEASSEAIADTALVALRGRDKPGLAPDFSTRRMAERHVELYARASAKRSSTATDGLVLVTNNFSTGGAQSSARRLLLALAAQGVPVRAVVIEEQEAFPTPGRAALSAAGIPVDVAPRAGLVDPLVTARAVAACVDAARPRAVLFWNAIPEHKVLIADLLLGVSVWDVSPGEMYFASFARYFQKPRIASPYLDTRDYGRLLEGAIVKYAAERTRAEEALGARVEVVPNGVVVPSVLPQRDRRGPLVVGTLARISPDKKLEQLVDAIAHARRLGRLPADVEVRIAGAPELGGEGYAAELREHARDLPIVWTGERDAAELLAELDLFAMVSEPSGCPNASLEAMAAGLPIVATDAGGAREQIAHGETGLVVPRGDAAALGEAIAELLADDERRAKMGASGHARARERFDVQRMAAEYARVCLDIAP